MDEIYDLVGDRNWGALLANNHLALPQAGTDPQAEVESLGVPLVVRPHREGHPAVVLRLVHRPRPRPRRAPVLPP